LSALTGVLALAAIYRLRVRRVQKMAQLLTHLVQERTRDDGATVDVRQLQPAGQPVRAGRDEDCVPVRVFPARFGRNDAACGRDRKGGFAVRV